MKKELGKWLLDIAKYVATAVVLSSVFGDMHDGMPIYMVGLLTVLLTLATGLWLVRDKKEGK